MLKKFKMLIQICIIKYFYINININLFEEPQVTKCSSSIKNLPYSS